MLYVSTRSRTDSYTAHRALHENRAPDGGMFVPFHLPFYTGDDLAALQGNTFGHIAAQILNVFFSVRLTGWDVDCCVGRYPVKLKMMSHRLILAEVWHNLESEYSYLERVLYSKLCGQDGNDLPTDWARIAIRIAVLFALYCEISADGITQLDVTVNSGDFSVPMAVWYARRMGLPIGTIICSGREEAVWELIQRGELTGASLRPQGLERLIHSTLGQAEVLRYIAAADMRAIYLLNEQQLAAVSDGMFVAMVGKVRIPSVIRSVFLTNDYVIGSDTALPYGGLQDYRARHGESRYTLIMAEDSPAFAAEEIAGILGVTADDIKKRVNTPKE